MQWAFLLVFVSAANAFSLSFGVPFLATNQKYNNSSQLKSSHNASKTVAIIGAGAGGSSAAFFISKAKERYGLDVDVHVYEKNEYIGGRSTTVHAYDDPTTRPIELGASVFVQANKNMWRASEEFNLSRVDFEDEDSATAIWDGQKFIVKMGDGPFGWWDKIKLAWRYGYYSFKNMDSAVQKMLGEFISLYAAESPSWDSVESLVTTLNWTEMVSQPASTYFSAHGVSDNLINEIIDAATRVNYGQNVDEIHALEGACSIAANGATQIEGGNWKIFDRFVSESGAKIFMNSTVKSIKWNGNSDTWTVKSPDGPVEYKAIILAAPYHSTSISIPDSISSQIPEQPYVHLHVTLLTTNASQPNPVYFGLPPTDKIPTTILTTSQTARAGGPEPEFNSLTYHGTIQHDGNAEHVVKIFSKETISDEWLANVFSDQVGWVLRKEWNAYPKLPPTSTFPPIKLDKGFFYVNAFEPFISTMETSTLAARNIVDLLLQEEFGTGLCAKAAVPLYVDGQGTEPEQEVLGVPAPHEAMVAEKEFVLGWDC